MNTSLPCLKRPLGFTIVEILVVLGVAAVFISVGIASYRDFNRRQSVEQAAEKIASDLRLAQNLAFVQKKPADCKNKLTGYVFSRSDLTYAISAECSGLSVKVKADSVSGVTLSGFTQVTFSVLGKGVSYEDDDASKKYLYVSLSGCVNCTKTITVEEAGEIKIY